MRKLITFLVVGLLFFGCSRARTSMQQQAGGLPNDEVILQVLEVDAPIAPRNRTCDYVPTFTLWGAGRAVFCGPDRFLHETVLGPETVKALIQDGSLLLGLKDKYIGSTRTDQLLTVFYVTTQRGTKTVKVYDLVSGQGSPELLSVSRLVENIRLSLPEHASLLVPDQVGVTYGHTGEKPDSLQEVPAWLNGTLSGQVAKEAISLVGLGEGKPFLVDGKPRTVVLVPNLPVLALLGDDKEYP